MKRINVIGTTGSGKSTFSEALANKTGYPCIQMDQLFWKPNWVESTDEEFLPKIRNAVSGDSWVLDGNYSRTNDIKWDKADTIIWVDYSFSRTLLQLFKRTVIRIFSNRELWVGTDNKESFKKSFASRDSIFLWFFTNYARNKIRYSQLVDIQKTNKIDLIRLRSPKQAAKFIESISSEQNKQPNKGSENEF